MKGVMQSNLNPMYVKRPMWCILKTSMSAKQRKAFSSGLRMQSMILFWTRTFFAFAWSEICQRWLSKTCRGGAGCCSRDQPCGEVDWLGWTTHYLVRFPNPLALPQASEAENLTTHYPPSLFVKFSFVEGTEWLLDRQNENWNIPSKISNKKEKMNSVSVCQTNKPQHTCYFYFSRAVPQNNKILQKFLGIR